MYDYILMDKLVLHICLDMCVCVYVFVYMCKCVSSFWTVTHKRNWMQCEYRLIENLPDDDDESLLLDESPLLESLESLLSLLDELEECRLRLFDFFFLPFFELPPSLRESAFVLPLIADDASPRLWSAILILSAKINRLITTNKQK